MRLTVSKSALLASLAALAAGAVVFTLTALAAHGRALPAAPADGPVAERSWQTAALPRASSVQTAELQMAIYPTQSVVALGESFTVAVAIENAPEIKGYDFKMDWDPQVFTVPVDAVSDDRFLGAGATTLKEVDNQEGTLTFAGFFIPPIPEVLPSGDGDLAIITLQATGVGTSTLDLYATRVFTRSGGMIRIADPGDGMAESTCDVAEIVDLAAESPVNVGQAAHFTATAAGAQPITFSWDFESDGLPERVGGGLDTVTHTYAARGVHTTTLTVDNVCGVEDMETVTLTVGGACEAVAITGLTSDSPVNIGEAMYFTASVTGTEPYTYTWDFGDEGTGSGMGLDTATPSWVYRDTGGYTVTLLVDNPCWSDEETERVSVEPYAIFLPLILRDYP